MSKYKGRKPQPQQRPRNMKDSAPQKVEAFTFGEPSAVLDRRDILDYVECVNNGRWFEPLRSALTGWQKACVPPFITARRFTLSATFWPQRLFRTRYCHNRTSAASRLIFWCLATRF